MSSSRRVDELTAMMYDILGLALGIDLFKGASSDLGISDVEVAFGFAIKLITTKLREGIYDLKYICFPLTERY
jgi:hypothetical protein